MTVLRCILSLSVNRYHELNDTHDNSMQSAYYRHFHWHCVYRQCIQMNKYCKVTSISLGFDLILLKPLFSYWKIVQCTPFFVFYFDFGVPVLLLDACAFCAGVFSRSTCSHILFSSWFISELLFSYQKLVSLLAAFFRARVTTYKSKSISTGCY